ncbi:MAG: hypothetical protein JW908_16215 [Anaerolineales bacterium]|nr:hypothetical protein [Anaerolineales bacterium]
MLALNEFDMLQQNDSQITIWWKEHMYGFLCLREILYYNQRKVIAGVAKG